MGAEVLPMAQGPSTVQLGVSCIELQCCFLNPLFEVSYFVLKIVTKTAAAGLLNSGVLWKCEYCGSLAEHCRLDSCVQLV